MKRSYCILTLVAVFMLAGSLPSAPAQPPVTTSETTVFPAPDKGFGSA